MIGNEREKITQTETSSDESTKWFFRDEIEKLILEGER